VFRAVFLQPHPSFDGLARQLDSNNYSFLNLENTKKGKKKNRPGNTRLSKHEDDNELSQSVKSSAAEEFDDMPSPSPSPSSHISKSLKVDTFRGQGHRRLKYASTSQIWKITDLL